MIFRLMKASFLAMMASGTLFASARIDSHPKLKKMEDSEVIEGSYIVMIRKGISPNNFESSAKSYVRFTYDAVLNGFSLQNAPDSVVLDLLNDSAVKAVHEDGKIYSSVESQEDVQLSATWGLDRIDQRNLPLDNTYNYDFDGTGVTIFVVDGGIRSTHEEFTGRFLECVDFYGGGCENHSFHGTHVAGTAVGTTYGVAKGANLVDFKVFDGDESAWSAIIAAFNEVATRKMANPSAKYVVNGSFGGGFNLPANQAAADCVAAGVVVVVSAGNEYASDSCSKSPASEPSVITVASTTMSDARSDFSNVGTCVDVFAPGTDITSAWNTGDTATNTIDGTSMASPHVAGIAALLLEEGYTPDQVPAQILALATPGIISDVRGSPNLLAFNGNNAPPVPVSIPVPAPAPAPAPIPVPSCPPGEALFTLILLTDNWPSEISWDVVNECDGSVVASGDSYTRSLTEYVENECIAEGELTFTIYDSASDGICCFYGNGEYSIYYDGVLRGSGGDYGFSESTTFGSCTAPAPSTTPAPAPSTTPAPAPSATPAPAPVCTSIVQRIGNRVQDLFGP